MAPEMLTPDEANELLGMIAENSNQDYLFVLSKVGKLPEEYQKSVIESAATNFVAKSFDDAMRNVGRVGEFDLRKTNKHRKYFKRDYSKD